MRLTHLVFTALISLALLVAGCSAITRVVTIGFIPTNNPEEMVKQFQPIKEYLEKEMKVKIKVEITENYLALVDEMKKKKVDIGWFGAFSYVTAEKEVKLEPLVLRYKQESGTSYYSLLITRADSEIKTLEDLRGKCLAFVDPASTSGFIIPYGLFKSRGIEIDNYFSKIIYSGTHEKVGMEVLNGTVDVGAISSTILSNLLDEHKIPADQIKVIWKSEEIPGSPFVARADLSKQLKDRFKEAMLNIHTREPQTMNAYDKSIEKFVVFDESLYNGVRNIARILHKDNILEQLLQRE